MATTARLTVANSIARWRSVISSMRAATGCQ
jgi:hypothetical protein